MTHRQTEGLNEDAVKILEDNQLLHIWNNLNRGGRRFINKAIRINQNGDAFSLSDFPEISKDSFKQCVFKLRRSGLVETITVSGCAFYRVKGFRLDPFWEKLTANPTEGSTSDKYYERRETVLEHLQEYFVDLEEPALHNIRVHFNSDYIYEKLRILYEEAKPSEIQYSPLNKSFIFTPSLAWGKHCSATIMVTPKNLVQVMIQNTFKPIAVNESGIYDLISKLGEIRYYLTIYSDKIPPVTDWLFVRADFGQDSKKPLGRLFPEMQFRHLTGALIRIYAKQWPDGKLRLRKERIISPKKTISEFQQDIIQTRTIEDK
jgi:hypothetical protein